MGWRTPLGQRQRAKGGAALTPTPTISSGMQSSWSYRSSARLAEHPNCNITIFSESHTGAGRLHCPECSHFWVRSWGQQRLQLLCSGHPADQRQRWTWTLLALTTRAWPFLIGPDTLSSCLYVSQILVEENSCSVAPGTHMRHWTAPEGQGIPCPFLSLRP